jgi:hypothetical protein
MSAAVFVAALLVYIVGYLIAALSSWNSWCDNPSNDMTDFGDIALGIVEAVGAGLFWPLAALVRGGLLLERIFTSRNP